MTTHTARPAFRDPATRIDGLQLKYEGPNGPLTFRPYHATPFTAGA